MEFTSQYSPSSKFTPEGLLVVDKGWEEVGMKILDSELFLKNRLKSAIRDGKHVLLLPGSYDILHAGHVTWIDQALSHFLDKKQKKGLSISRKDVLVVVPVNSDPLVNVSKGHLHQTQGGDEKAFRPIVSQDLRLLALANLDSVDLTVAIPSPLYLDTLLPQPNNFSVKKAQRSLDVYRQRSNLKEKDYSTLLGSLKTYKTIQEAQGYSNLTKEFKRLLIPIEYIEKIEARSSEENWDDVAWELMWYLYLSEKAHYKLPEHPALTQRILSLRDGYGPKAQYIAQLAGIAVDSIMDTHITSTTELISTYGRKPSILKELVASTNLSKFTKTN